MQWYDSFELWVSKNGTGLVERLTATVLVLLATLVIAAILSGWVRRVVTRARGETLAGAAATTAKAAVIILGGMTAADHMGLDVKALLAGVGVLGLAVGFGAQSLVKDVISGFFLILDGVLKVGDIAQVGEATGVIEEVGLRRTCVRAFDGQLFYVPNGQIAAVGSYSRGWTRAVVEVGVAYEQDVRRALSVLKQVGDEIAAEQDEIVLEPPEAQGVMSFGASEVAVRLVVKVKAAEHWALERELRQRIKAAFDAEGVEIPFPRQVVYRRTESSSELAPSGTE
jgi:small-conductance mechanosensitive channel